ncbi:MAG: DUF3667 domain-containing protein [Ginsengibacter sp.]
MKKQCLNCGYPVELNYCPQSSQSTSIGRISWRSFLAEFFHAVTHAEKGIFGTTWQLVKDPGKVMNEYLSGKRKKYHSPVTFFLVWVTVSILLQQASLALSGFHPVYLKGLTFSSPESIRIFIKEGEWLYILTFPICALLLYLILTRPIFSYIESIVITMYTFSIVYMFHTLCYIIGGLLLRLNVLHWGFYLFQIIVSFLYSIWVCYSAMRRKKIKFLWPRILLYMLTDLIVVLRFLEFLSISWARLEENM